MSLAARLIPATGTGTHLDVLPGDLLEAEPVGTPAAVLVAVTDRPAPGVILTVRRADMRKHAGQVAFPGGRVDPGEDAIMAALREAKEEIDLEPGHVSVLGESDPYRTVTGFLVTPVVGIIPPDLPIHPNEAEVADWFEAPLDFVLDPANQQRLSVEFEGRERQYYQIDWQGRRIWGATAAMIVNLSRRLAA